jgi:hypothetical protein
MPDDIESYWEGIRPPRDKPKEEAPKPSGTWWSDTVITHCDHIDPTKIEGYRISEEARYLLEDPVDGDTYCDHQGEHCFIFRPPWYKLHRWIWWLFITGGIVSFYEWTHTRIDGKIFKAYRRKREWSG